MNNNWEPVDNLVGPSISQSVWDSARRSVEFSTLSLAVESIWKPVRGSGWSSVRGPVWSEARRATYE